MTWTHFYDMSSGGSQKEEYNHIFIEASQKEAEIIFYNYFGHSPYNVSCSCCGSDYSVSESDTLEKITKYYNKYDTLKEYLKDPDVHVIYNFNITPDMKKGKLPEDNYE